MSSEDDNPRAIPVPPKKRRVQRACDMCRLKRRACDGLRMSEKKCTNCVENAVDCTFAGTVAKRRSYVDALEARLELTEELLRKLSAQNTSEPSTSAAPSPGSSTRWSSDSPVLKHANADIGVTKAGSEAGPGVLLAALNIRSMNTPAPEPHADDLAHHALVEDMEQLSIQSVNNRFLGKSSGAMLVKAAVLLREGYEERDMPWTSRRMHYWTYNPSKNRVPHTGPFVFPPADLLSSLIDLYFVHKNVYFPLLHRPSFERSVADGLHLREPAFGTVLLLVCAMGSRFSDDPRVCPPGTEPLKCGWEFFDQVPFQLGHLFEKPSVWHLQYYCLATSFLEFSVPSACWTLIGLGIRLAQDVGVHRAAEPGVRPTLESELWKRGFWVLVSYDRQVSMALGRGCATQYEDMDLDLPIECDDEFWVTEVEDPAKAWAQPAGRPSQITFFNCYLRLNNLLAFALKMLYTLNKTKKMLAHRDPKWEEHIVAELDSALNGWIDSIPAHLRWDPNRRDDVFFDQSAFLYCSYYQVQMTIHRPFIPTVREQGGPSALPSLAICTNAARSCSHVADISRLRKNGAPMPVLLSSVFTSGLVLLLNVWSGKRTGLPPQMNSAITEVHRCLAVMRGCEGRWQSAGLFYDLLYEIASIGQLPLPTASPPADAATPNPHKRGREEEEDAQYRYPQGGAPAVHYPNTYAHAAQPTTVRPQQQQQQPWPAPLALPTYTADLGRLPVFHQQQNQPQPFASTSSWYPTQSAAPLGNPNFAVAHSTDAFDYSLMNSFSVGALDTPILASTVPSNMDMSRDPGMGLPLSNGVMAMWASAPTGFEVDDWGTYFSVMNELSQELEPGPAVGAQL
ncbi:fungal-specific transcription factor domain-containing protein [Mycena vitilis]|nr:fungal-specific transcription factor domain-containing protein [Mycena vitilis]